MRWDSSRRRAGRPARPFEHVHAKPCACIHPELALRPSGAPRQRLEAHHAVLVRTLGVDRLAAREAEAAAPHGDALGVFADQVHLDALAPGVPACLVAERARREVGAELAVHACEQILVERGGDPLCVVVGRDQHRRIRRRIGADDHQRTRADRVADAVELRHRIVGLEVADRRAGEEHEPAAPSLRKLRQRLQGAEVGHDGLDRQRREAQAQCLHRFGQELLGDVDRQIGRRCVERAEQQRCLAARSAAEFDHHGARPRLGGDRSGAMFEDPGLGARRVVLGQSRDLLEELGATVVVQPGCRNRLLRQRQTGEHVARKCVAGGG